MKNNIVFIIIFLLLIIIFGLVIYSQKIIIDNLKDKHETEINLINALTDSVKIYQNKEKEWVAEKLTIQESFKNLEKINNQLNSSQKELLNRIKEIEKNSKIIAAALIETNIKIEYIKPHVVVKDSSVTFVDSTKNLKYDIEVGHVKPINLQVLPTLTFNKFEMPNKQFVEFHWKNNRNLGYPVTFSVTNTNDYFKTTNIESYAIPNLKRKDINPNAWDRFIKWSKKNRTIIISTGVGVVGGIAGYLLLSK